MVGCLNHPDFCEMDDEEINDGNKEEKTSDDYVCGDCGKSFKRGYRLGSHYWCEKCNGDVDYGY